MHRNNKLWKQMTYYGQQVGINPERKILLQKNNGMKITKVHKLLQKLTKIKKIQFAKHLILKLIVTEIMQERKKQTNSNE